MVFIRPESLEYPKVWREFQVSRPGGQILNLKIQDLTSDMFEESVQLLLKHFTKDEPPCKHIGVTNHPIALGELEKLWRKSLEEKISLVCLVDDLNSKRKIVGLNVLSVICKDDKVETFQTEDKVWGKLFGAVDLVARSVDIFHTYDVDKYLSAYGLIVVPEYRGMNIGKEILLSRIPLCKALAVKISVTVFTAASSQVLAEKAGFIDLFEITYEELAEKGFVFPGVSESTKSSKLMALIID